MKVTKFKIKTLRDLQKVLNENLSDEQLDQKIEVIDTEGEVSSKVRVEVLLEPHFDWMTEAQLKRQGFGHYNRAEFLQRPTNHVVLALD